MAFRVNRRKYKRMLRKRKIGKRGGRGGARKRQRRTTVVNRTFVREGLGLPKKIQMTHKYCEQLTLNSGAGGALQTYNWACNGMYDPNITGVGHQPMYFDQMSALYDHYHVIGSKIKAKVVKDATYAPITIGMFVNDDATTTPTILGVLENSSAKHVLLPNDRTAVVSAKWSAKKNFGGSILGNNALQGSAAANPTEGHCFTFFVDGTIATSQTSVYLDVEIEYIAIWHELKDIASS